MQPSFSDLQNGASPVQGFAPDEVANTSSLRSGLVAPSQKSPLWGGMAVTVSVPGSGLVVVNNVPRPALAASVGPVLSLATATSNITGFTTFNQSDRLSMSAQNSVPQARAGDGTNPGGAINFFTLKSRARLWLQCSKDAAAALDGGSITPTVYWDYKNQRLITRPAIGNDSPISVTVFRVTEKTGAHVVTPDGTCWESGCAALIQI
jgi:hypothetical protein